MLLRQEREVAGSEQLLIFGVSSAFAYSLPTTRSFLNRRRFGSRGAAAGGLALALAGAAGEFVFVGVLAEVAGDGLATLHQHRVEEAGLSVAIVEQWGEFGALLIHQTVGRAHLGIEGGDGLRSVGDLAGRLSLSG